MDSITNSGCDRIYKFKQYFYKWVLYLTDNPIRYNTDRKIDIGFLGEGSPVLSKTRIITEHFIYIET